MCIPSMAAGMTMAMNSNAASTSASVKPAVDRRRAFLIATAFLSLPCNSCNPFN